MEQDPEVIDDMMFIIDEKIEGDYSVQEETYSQKDTYQLTTTAKIFSTVSGKDYGNGVDTNFSRNIF